MSFTFSSPGAAPPAGTSSSTNTLLNSASTTSTTSATSTTTEATYTFGGLSSCLRDAGEKNKSKEAGSGGARVPPFGFGLDVTFPLPAAKDLNTPWRNVQWTETQRSSLIKTISSYRPSSDEVTQARVLLLGPVGSGKSSFISSVQSAFRGRVTNRAMLGSSSSSASFTKKLQSFTIRGQQREDPTSLVLFDTMGLGSRETTGPTLHDILSVINGHLPEGHKFRPDQAVSSETEGYVKWPGLRHKTQCLVFVVDGSKMVAYPEDLSATFRQLREHISDLGIHQVALLTHIDKVCPKTKEDISNVYKSVIIKERMEKASDLLGMPLSYIVPVKNYSSELEVEVNTDVLLLSAVDHILQYTELFFEDYKPEPETN